MAQLTPEQRQQAIRTMVEGLAARLADALAYQSTLTKAGKPRKR